MPGATLVETGSVQKVTLVLGANGVQAEALSAKAPKSSQPTQNGQSKQRQAAARAAQLHQLNPHVDHTWKADPVRYAG